MAKLGADDQSAVRVYKALGHPQRFRIVRMLGEREELGCGELMASCGLSAPALSHHTRILLECGLLLVRREGAYHYFSLDTEQLARYAPGLVTSRAGPRR